MYTQFYGFSERPFSLLPDPDYLFFSHQHQTALALLETAVINNSGFCMLSGEIGAGKTTLLRELLNRLDDDVTIGLVNNTHASFGNLMQWILGAFGLVPISENNVDQYQQFVDFVIGEYAKNRHTLLIIDEAQQLTPESMEELRMLSNINSDKDFVLQVIIAGQNELRVKCNRLSLLSLPKESLLIITLNTWIWLTLRITYGTDCNMRVARLIYLTCLHAVQFLKTQEECLDS